MKNFADYFPRKINESLDEQLRDKLREEYKSLKRGILNLVEKSIDNPDELINAQNFIYDYIQEDTEKVLNNFVEDGDVFDTYLKYQDDIDTLLNDNDYYSEVPSDNNVFSLYDYVVTGTKKAVKIAMENIYQEIFE